MTDTVTLLSWSRRGAGAAASVGAARRDGRRPVAPPLRLEGHQGPVHVGEPLTPAGVTLLGPADCDGVNPQQIVRRSPVPGDVRHEPNFLALIEFGHADLPWLFSGSAEGDKLHPWLMLVVVRSGRAGRQGRIRSGPRGAVLHVDDGSALSRPSDAWAFAHIQVAGSADAGAVVSADPQAAGVRSRIMCPTRMAPNTDYIAALVPTFELGRLAGLGIDVPADPDDRFWTDGKGKDALNPPGFAFWNPHDGIRLPAYDHWAFTTGPAGDFESLARKLRRVPSKEGLGERRVAVEARASLMQDREEGPGQEAPVFEPGVECVPTAITRVKRDAAQSHLGPFAPDVPAPTQRAAQLQARLKELIDLVAAAEEAEPVVGPPLYGQWPADARSLELSATGNWVTQLNADPYQRIAAGVGARVVCHDQEALMADAWRQLADLEEANRRIRLSALMATALHTLHTKLDLASEDIRLRFTSTCFGRITPNPGRTLHAEVQTTTLPVEALGPSMVRVAARARRAALASSQVSQAVDAAVRPTTISAGAVKALTTSSAAVMPQRFTRQPQVDLDVVKTVVDVPALVDKLTTLDNLATMTAKIADRFVEPDPGLEVSVHDDVVVQLAPAVADQIGERDWLTRTAVDAAVGVPIAPERQVLRQGPGAKIAAQNINPGVLKKALQKPVRKIPPHAWDVVVNAEHLGAVAEPQPVPVPAPRVTMSVRDLAAVHRAEIEVPAGVALSLASDDVKLALGPALRAAPRTLLAATITEPTNAAALGVTEAMHTSVLAEFGITRSSAATRLGQLSDGDIAVYRAAAERIAGQPDSAIDLPHFAVFDPTATQAAVTALAPLPAYRDLLSYAHTVVSDDVVRLGRSWFQPLGAAPKFTQPLVRRLAAVDKDWLLGGVSGLAPNSVSVFGVNARFIEAFLAGANHEMMRELIWRGYPTNVRGTCFRRFWDLPQPDVKPLTGWTSLGENHSGDTRPDDLTVVVIKGDLLRRYPNTIISAVHGRVNGDQFDASEEAGELDRDHIDDDISYSILKIAPHRLLERGEGLSPPRWYISLLENTHEPRFGLDDSAGHRVGANNGLAHGDWSWQGLSAEHQPGSHLTAAALNAAATSTQVGVRLCQTPFRALLPATEYIVLD